MKEKVVIIGAGPVGCYLGKRLKDYGFSPLIIEEHHEVGRPLHCTGIVGRAVFDQISPASVSRSSIVNTINGATIHFNGDSFDIARENSAYILERDRFDKELSGSLDIVYGNKFLGFEKVNDGYIIETDQGGLSADITVGADGADSSVRKFLFNNHAGHISYHRGFQLRIKLKPRRVDFVEVFIGDSSFFWIVPEDKMVVRVGVISNNPFYDLQEFMKNQRINGDVLEKFGGLVTVGFCPETVRDNVALVGGAACQVKPLTYGGIYFGMRAADILADSINSGRLADYDSLWKKELGSEIKIGAKLKYAYERLNAEELKKIFYFLKSQKDLIEKYADFENHSRFFIEIVKNPGLYPLLGDLLSIFVRALM